MLTAIKMWKWTDQWWDVKDAEKDSLLKVGHEILEEPEITDRAKHTHWKWRTRNRCKIQTHNTCTMAKVQIQT